MGDVALSIAQEAKHLLPRSVGPNSLSSHIKSAHLIDVMIIFYIFNYLVSVLTQERAFGCKNCVFTTGLLVEIMN